MPRKKKLTKAELLEQLKPKLRQVDPTDDRDRVAQILKADEAVQRQAIIDSTWGPSNKLPALTGLEREILEEQERVLTAVVLEEKRSLGAESFWYFFTQSLFPRVWTEHYTDAFHGWLANYVQALAPGSNFMAILPREHRKSFLLNLGYAIWQITRNVNIRIMLIGSKEAAAKKWSILIRSAFMPNTDTFKDFQTDYHDFVFKAAGMKKSTLQATSWTVENRTESLPDSTFFATYLGVTGAGGRANLQIFDDPYERRNVSNPDQSAKALAQTLDLFPLVEIRDTAYLRQRIFLVTRWAYHDPTASLIGENTEGLTDIADALAEAPPFQAIVRHSFENPKVPCQHCPPHITAQFPHGNPDVEAGEVILEPILSRAGLMQRLAEYKADPEKGEALWYHQYQNVCKAPKDQKIQEDWFVTAPFYNFPAAKLRVLAIDSADKDFQRERGGDYMVSLFGEFDDYARLCLPHGIRSNSFTRALFINAIIAWCKSTGWWPHIVVKEKFGQDTFLTDIGEQFKENYQVPHLLAATRPSTQTANFMKKLDWIIESLQAPLERREIICGSHFPPALFHRLKHEGVNLGQIVNDDVIDTLALFYSKGVRPETGGFARRPMGTPLQAPPDLGLYDVNQPSGIVTTPHVDSGIVQPKSPIQQALESERLQPVIQELGRVQEREVDTPGVHVKLDY